MNLFSDDEQIWISLRERSLKPGGFGRDRIRIWPALLGAQPLSDPPPYSEVESASMCGGLIQEETNKPVADPHADERQIKLDTDRSFVLYPGESDETSARDELQNDLHKLLVLLFRKRRSLHYFQGFHDIMTVIFLTLPRPLHFVCAEKMALHRVRDSMGVGLEPILGLLRVLRNLLRVADPAYAKLLENTSPLPYHALSHLLTLFSHDVPTLPLIQHVWDFLLSREPIAVVWLAAALILHRKTSVCLLAEQDEEGMIHSLLGGIPELVDAEPEFCDACIHEGAATDLSQSTGGGAVSVKSVTRSNLGGDETGTHVQPSPQTTSEMLGSLRACDTIAGDADGLAQSSVSSGMTLSDDALQGNSPGPSARSILPPEATNQNYVGGPHDSLLEFAVSIPLPDSPVASPVPSPGSFSPAQPSTSLPQEASPTDHHNSSLQTSACLSPCSHSSSGSRHSFATEHCIVVSKSPPHFDEPVPGRSRIKPRPLSLTYLLRRADDLLAEYPPSHPSLCVSEIMGPDSAMRTWRPPPVSANVKDAVPEKRAYSYTDDYLESLVKSPYVVVPSPPPSPLLDPRIPSKKLKASPRTLSKALFDPRRISWRLGALTPAERRVLFMGALFVVGVAMALKSGKIPYAEGIVKPSGGDGLKRLWNGKWTIVSSMVAAWGRGLP